MGHGNCKRGFSSKISLALVHDLPTLSGYDLLNRHLWSTSFWICFSAEVIQVQKEHARVEPGWFLLMIYRNCRALVQDQAYPSYAAEEGPWGFLAWPDDLPNAMAWPYDPPRLSALTLWSTSTICVCCSPLWPDKPKTTTTKTTNNNKDNKEQTKEQPAISKIKNKPVADNNQKYNNLSKSNQKQEKSTVGITTRS